MAVLDAHAACSCQPPAGLTGSILLDDSKSFSSNPVDVVAGVAHTFHAC